MGLFDIFKKKSAPVTELEEETVDQAKIDWFFSKEGEKRFYRCKRNYDAMMQEYREELNGLLDAYISAENDEYDSNLRNEFLPCTFFADYLRACNLFLEKGRDYPGMRLTVYLADMTEDGDVPGIPYPDCLKAETSPLIDFVEKFNPICKQAEAIDGKTLNDIKYLAIFLMQYIHRTYCFGLDISDETWMYEPSLYFKPNGKMRKEAEIKADMEAKVKFYEHFKL